MGVYMDKYSINDCIDIFMYDNNPTKDFYYNCEKYMNALFRKLSTYKTLSVEEYIFLIFCFDNKLQDWSRLCEEENISGKDQSIDMSKDFIEFENRFLEKSTPIIIPVLQNFMEKDKNKLQIGLSKLLKIYKEAKLWMIKNGYKV